MITKHKAVEAAVGDHKTTLDDVAGFDKSVGAIKQGVEAATATVEHSQVQMKEGLHRAMKKAEQVTQFSQGNVEAMMKSGQILATGLTDMSKLMAASAKVSLDETMSVFKAMTSVKSVKEAFELQTNFARTAMEKAMSEGGKLTDQSLKLAEQAMAPISARVNVAVATFSS